MRKPHIPRWIGYLASSAVLAHAMLSYYWALGGTAGLELLSTGIQEMAAEREAWFVALVWGTATIKGGLSVIALALTRGWTLPLPRWMPVLVAWSAGLVMTAYGLLQITSLVVGGLIMAGGEDLPQAYWAYLILWMPLWLVIGVAFVLLAWRSTGVRRKSPA